jgi:hypothetical protein
MTEEMSNERTLAQPMTGKSGARNAIPAREPSFSFVPISFLFFCFVVMADSMPFACQFFI